MMASSQISCSLTLCLEAERCIPDSAPRIEVGTVLPTKCPESKKSKFIINWSRTGEAKFHPDCWAVVLKSSRARNVKNAQLKFKDASEKLMVKEANKTAERHDGKELVEAEAVRIAQMMKLSKHCVAFTGAGISTSAGIGDYRGKSGKWTQDDRAAISVDIQDGAPSTKKTKSDLDSASEQKDVQRNKDDDDGDDDDEDDGVPYEQLRPTYTHEALQHLVSLGHIKYIISQNGDGLHTLSGVPEDHISELHGNVFKEKCEKCGHVYDRHSYVMDDVASQYYEELEDNGKTDIVKPKHAVKCQKCGLCHRTGRKCTKRGCKGHIMDTIINFRDNLEEAILDRAERNACQSDMMLCLGTTLAVTPACDLVEMGQEPLRLVVCNRQETAVDSLCLQKDPDSKQPRGARVFGDCDVLMREVMKSLLSQKALLQWEGERNARMKDYDKLRKS